MKKAVFALALLGSVSVSVHGVAQEKYVVTALTAMKSNNYDEAKESIDKAYANADSKDKPKTLYARGYVYSSLQGVDKYKAANPYREANTALIKLVEVKPDYEKQAVDGMLLRGAFLSFNDAVKAYNDKKYDESVELMKTVIKIHGLSNRFTDASPAQKKQFDEVAADATLTIGNCNYYQGKTDEAATYYQKVIKDGIRKSPNVYDMLARCYLMQKNGAAQLAAIQDGRKDYPNDPTLATSELNYYIQSGKTDELVKKLEEAAQKDPGNGDIQFNLATTYSNMANPKDGKKPANATDLMGKAETAFQNAVKASPENPIFNYNFGALYFNQATEVNEQMNAITGTSAADNKKYDDLKAKRDALFNKSLPYFEKVNSIYSAQGDVKGEEKITYKAALTALTNIYNMQSKLDKAADTKKKAASL